MIQNKYFDLYLENPLKTYKAIKKYFRPIKPKFQWSWYKSNKAKILEINSFDLMWKDKWNSPRPSRQSKKTVRKKTKVVRPCRETIGECFVSRQIDKRAPQEFFFSPCKIISLISGIVTIFPYRWDSGISSYQWQPQQEIYRGKHKQQHPESDTGGLFAFNTEINFHQCNPFMLHHL